MQTDCCDPAATWLRRTVSLRAGKRPPFGFPTSAAGDCSAIPSPIEMTVLADGNSNRRDPRGSSASVSERTDAHTDERRSSRDTDPQDKVHPCAQG